MAPSFQLLGPPGFDLGGARLEPPPAWAMLLLGFVASQEHGVSRGEIVGNFWPEVEESKARHNLSQFLYRYRGAAWMAGLEVARDRLLWVAESDLSRFRQAAATGDWGEALELYRGEFLAGVQADRWSEVSEWLYGERSELASAWREAALQYAAELDDRESYSAAADALRPVLAAQPLAEDVLHAYMRSEQRAGRRSRGLTAYEAFRDRLREELDIEPTATTSKLAEELRKERAQRQTAPQGSDRRPLPAAARSAGRGLPAQLTPFIGRDIELAELATSLSLPERRLITIVGPGGVGKSRIALQVAKEQAERYPDGVHFVALAALDSPAYIASAIAASVGLDHGAEGGERQLAGHLASRTTLLILDNFEHLLEGAGLLSRLLSAAQGLTILATSRQQLGLQQEWCYELKGLSYPPAGDDEFTVVYEAVQLLLGSARRNSSSFSLAESDKAALARIGRLLGGLPLALELAGGWLRLLPPAELAAELERDLDLLESDAADRPARHRSLRVVFENSWELLSPREREALSRLAVFRGGFDRQAAQLVSVASLKTLLGLASKSLLGRSRDGRFELLESVRQYAHDKLAADEVEHRAARQRHALHFVSLAEEAEAGMRGAEQGGWLDRLALERGNLRAALDWTLESAQAEPGLRLASALQQFWWVRGPYSEGSGALDSLLRLPGTLQLPALRAKALHRAGTLFQEQGDFDGARQRYLEALELARATAEDRLTADALHSLGLLEAKLGESEAALSYYAESAVLQRNVGDLWGLSVTLNNTGVALIQQGHYREAIAPLRESLEYKRRLAEAQGEAYALNNLGTVHYLIGDLGAARSYVEESLELKQGVGDDQGVATSLANLGRIAREEGDYAVARGHFSQSISRLGDLRNHWTLLWALTGLVKLEALAGRAEHALRLAGGVESLAERLRVTLPAPNAQELGEGLARAQRQIAAERARSLLDEGRRMAPLELVGYVLSGGSSGGVRAG